MWTYQALYVVIILPFAILSIIAMINVKYTYSHYDKFYSQSECSGYEVARYILDHNDCKDVKISNVPGELTDCYDPITKTLFLSNSVYFGKTISAYGIAAHECGHALQEKNEYLPFKVRQTLIPIVNTSSYISRAMIIIGLLFSAVAGWGILLNLANHVITIGIILYGVGALFHFITVFVELDASKRAVTCLKEYSFLNNFELRGVKKVLWAAALTYIANLARVLAHLLRLLIFRRLIKRK